GGHAVAADRRVAPSRRRPQRPAQSRAAGARDGCRGGRAGGRLAVPGRRTGGLVAGYARRPGGLGRCQPRPARRPPRLDRGGRRAAPGSGLRDLPRNLGWPAVERHAATRRRLRAACRRRHVAPLPRCAGRKRGRAMNLQQWVLLVLALAVLAGAVRLWRAHRLDPRGPRAWRLVALLILQPLLAGALYLTLFPPERAVDPAALVLLTEGAGAAEAAGADGIVLALPEAGEA